ncbi:MAG: acetoacetate--CoA ligase [Burkholderiaceae bacterium]
MNSVSNTPIWRPDATRTAAADITRFTAWLQQTRGLNLPDYESLWRWSTDEIEAFWEAVWQWFEIRSHSDYKQVLLKRQMPGAKWFEGATLNYAEHLLRRAQEPDAGQTEALVFRSELTPRRSITWKSLETQVGALMKHLKAQGVTPGDRCVSYLPNIPETVVAMLATTGLGAIWSSCAPDMGATGVLDRFQQIKPKVLFAVDGYRYSGKDHDRTGVVTDLVAQLPDLEALVYIPLLSDAELAGTPDADAVIQCCQQDAHRVDFSLWCDAVNHPNATPEYAAVPFDHPLWIVYSSGTTGMPKPIVHGHGGTLLEGLKANRFHLDVGRDDRFFWFSSTSWIMWNLWVSTLATGCTVLHYDGNPGYPDLHTLWDFAAQEKASFFGTSPAFIGLNMKAGIVPRADHDLSSLKTLGATGSPLTEEAYEWVYKNINSDILLASISGGTDPGAAFLTSSPALPVYPGQMQCRGLGCAVASFNESGESQLGEVGELVVTEPMPSMPLYFWGDTDGERYRTSYFETWPHAWQHGDWLALFEQPESITSVIYGRSDSTINRHGIRMGSSELYRVIEGFDWVLDSLVVDLEYLGKPSQLLLFVVPRQPFGGPGSELAEPQADQLKAAIASALSNRHVPNGIWEIAEVPRTMSGKKLEVPVKRILLGHEPAKVINRASMANPEAIDWFVAFSKRR